MVTKSRALEPPIDSEYFTVAETGVYARHGERTVWRWIQNGELPFHRVAGGRRILIARADIDRLIEEGRVEPRTKAPWGRTQATSGGGSTKSRQPAANSESDENSGENPGDDPNSNKYLGGEQ